MASQTIDILLNPVIDKGRFSAVVESLKTGSGIINIPASITTDKAGFDGVVKASEQGGKQAGEKFSDTFKVGYKSLTSGLDTLTKNALSPILSVFGGNLLTKGFSSIVGGFGDWIEKGKGVLATTNAMQTAFAQTGKSGKDLDKAIADTNKVAGKLSNQFAMSVADVREYSKAAAVLGGATGKQNENLTKLGIAIEKSTNGMVSGTMAIRLFSKGVSDPESEFALARLTKQYPALGSALKGLKEPAEVTAKALSFFGPTFKTMEQQSKGALGSFTILQNNLNAVKTAFGSVIIEAIAPFASSFAQTIVPAVQAFTGYIKGFAGYLKPLAPLFVAVGSAAATMVGSLLAMQGVNYLGGLITQGIQFSQTILTKVLPSLFAQTTAEGALVFSTEALTFANIKNAIASKAKLALDYLQSTAIYQLVAGQISLNAAMAANPIGLVIAGAVALGGALYLLYDNVESVRNVFDAAWDVIVVGAKVAWEALKAYGSMLAEIGGMVYEFISIPFKMAWSVISGIGGAIGSLVGSLLGMSGAGLTLQSVFTGIQQAGQVAIDIFNTVKATIAGITGAVGAFTDSIADGIGKVFSLDLGGAWDSFTGAGDKAAQAFNDKFNDKMRTANFESAAKSIEKGLESAKDIEVKVKAKTDFQDTLKSYEETQKKIDELSSKPKSSLTANQVKELEDLKLKAAEYSTQIQKIAPATVNSMSAVVGANGQLTTSYDINIAKAKEFGKANDFTQSLDNQKQAVSKSISDMTNTYASQEDVVKKMKKELEKPITNQAEHDKLKQSFADATAKAEEMKTQLIDNFTKAGAAGMLTETAISKVAKSLGVTNSVAKDMLISKELEKSADAGLLTEKQITKLTEKYGVSKDKVQEIFDKQKAITAETKATQQAAENWGGALDRVKKAQAKASEDALTAQMKYKKGLITKEELDEQIKLSEATMKTANDEMKVAKQVKKEIESNKNLKAVGLEDEKKTTKEKVTQYEIDKQALEDLKKKQKIEEDRYVKDLELTRLKSGFIETEKSKLNDSIAKNQRVLAEYKAQQEVLNKMMSDTDNLSEKDGKRAKAVKETQEQIDNLNSSIASLNKENEGIAVKIEYDDEAQKKAFEKLKLDAQNLELEGKIKLGLISETQKVKIEIDKIELDKAGINEAIQKVESELSKDTDNQELKNKIQSYKNDLLKLNNDLDVKNAEYLDKSSRDRISSIADTVERERALKIYELKKTYDEEIYLAQGNAQKLLVINQAYADNRNRIEQDYLAKTSFSYNALTKLSTAFANIKVGSVDRNEIVNLNKTKSDLAKERQELENSYAVGKTDYESYQKSLSDIQNKESENRIAIEEAEAERRKAIWSGFTTAVSGYFGTMYDEYSKKASESVNAVIQSQDTEYRIKQEKALANSALQASIENNNYLMQATMKAKLTELDNQDLANKTANSEAISALYTNLSVSAGSMFAQMMADNESFGKSILKTAFAVAKAIVPVLTIQILGKEFVEKGPIGAITAAAMTATLYGAIALAESAVSGAFRNGVVNFQGKGTGTSDSNLVRISHGESVMTAKATANPINQKFFNYANKGGDLVSFLQTDKDIQRQLAQQRIMQSYESVSRQKEMFDRIVADYNNTNKQLKEQNRELVNEIITMKNELVEAFRTNVKIENHQNWRLEVENKVVKAVEQLDLSGR